jgi:hypothetical protein
MQLLSLGFDYFCLHAVQNQGDSYCLSFVMLVGFEHLDARLLGVSENAPLGRRDGVVADGGVCPIQRC